MAITQSTISRAKRYEGDVPHMYLDDRGNVTVGVGIHLASASDATPLPFVRKSDQQAATAEEKQTDWDTIKGKEAGRRAGFYEQFALLRLQQADIDALLLARLNTSESELRRNFPAYDSFPAEAQEGLLDMHFNLGLTKLLGFSRFVAAARAQDWFLAAAESRRGGVQPERNDETRQLFETAGQRSRVLEGTWSGPVTPTGLAAVQATVVFTKIGSNAYSGRITGVSEGQVFNEPLSNIRLSPDRNISFDFPADDTAFRGRINEQFNHMSGNIFDGQRIDGMFNFRRQ